VDPARVKALRDRLLTQTEALMRALETPQLESHRALAMYTALVDGLSFLSDFAEETPEEVAFTGDPEVCGEADMAKEGLWARRNP